MALIPVGDAARALTLQRHTNTAKAGLARLTEELASRRHTDPARRLNGELAPLAGITSALARITGWQVAAREIGHRMEAMQNTLSAIDAEAGRIATALLSSGGEEGLQPASAISEAARDAFIATIGVLNTRYGDRALFAGTATDGVAMADAGQILAVLETVVGAADTPDAAMLALDSWFADPAGFGTTAYRGSAAPAGPIAIAEGETIRLALTAADPPFRDTLKAFALAALAETAPYGLDPAHRAEAHVRAGTILMGAAPARAAQAATLGFAEARVASVLTRHSAEAAALEISRSEFLEPDPYRTAVDLESTRIQIETIFAMTARLSRLSLVDYLR